MYIVNPHLNVIYRRYTTNLAGKMVFFALSCTCSTCSIVVGILDLFLYTKPSEKRYINYYLVSQIILNDYNVHAYIASS